MRPPPLRKRRDHAGADRSRCRDRPPLTTPAATTDIAATPAPAAASEPATTATVTAPPAEQRPRPSRPRAVGSTGRRAGAEPGRRDQRAGAACGQSQRAEPRPAPLRARAAEPVKLNGQVAVFISGKEKRIFVRHAFVPVFDMPIEIANPGKPLGTHTFTALEVVDGGTRMRWNVISMPLTAGQPAAPASQEGRCQATAAADAPRTCAARSSPATSSNATEALDRVTIPQEAIDRIAELLTPGSSLIITDEGLGRETGRYTEFIVETR